MPTCWAASWRPRGSPRWSEWRQEYLDLEGDGEEGAGRLSELGLKGLLTEYFSGFNEEAFGLAGSEGDEVGLCLFLAVGVVAESSCLD